jgi:hypothetical protein
MSRELPSRPNLEHLRKQAKHVLEDLQRTDPNAKLADAQHMLARSYGFTSWPALHAHVETLRSAIEDRFGEVAPEVPEAVTTNGTSPFTGRWTANVSKSQRHELNPFRQATLEIDVADDVVTIIHSGVDGLGVETRDTNSFVADGAEHEQRNGYVLRATWRGPRVLETLARRDGQVVGAGTYEVSADGNTLTITGEGQKVVLEKT